jgi:hypothetical protein
MKYIYFLLAIVAIGFTGCFKDDNNGVTTNSVTLNGTNVVPAITTSGTAKFDYSFNANTNTFTYKIDYSGLTDSCTQFGISKVLPGQLLPTSTFQLFNFGAPSSLQRRVNGTFNGFFVVDGFQMTLNDLRSGQYSVYLRRRNPATPTSVGFEEVRAQITF